MSKKNVVNVRSGLRDGTNIRSRSSAQLQRRYDSVRATHALVPFVSNALHREGVGAGVAAAANATAA